MIIDAHTHVWPDAIADRAIGAASAEIKRQSDGGCCGTASMCTPRMVDELVKQFPRLDLIAAHLGGYHHLDEAESEIIGLPVYIDTSWPLGIGSLDPKRVRAIIERLGTERVLFGSDWPMGNPATDIAALEALELPAADLDTILRGNAMRLLQIYDAQ